MTAAGRDRRGEIAASAVATMHVRRSVLRLFFRTACDLGLTFNDPTRELPLPPRSPLVTRAITEDEADLLRHFAFYSPRASRHAAVLALALAGAHSGEIGHISLADLHIEHARVYVHGSSKTRPRWCALDPWAMGSLTLRIAALRRSHHGRELDPQTLLASTCQGSEAAQQARVCVAIRDVMIKAGLGQEADLRPTSVTAYAGRLAFNERSRIEDAANVLGMNSLDRVARLIGHDWPTR